MKARIEDKAHLPSTMALNLDSIRADFPILSRRLEGERQLVYLCLLYTSPSPRDRQKSRMPSSA